MSKSLGNYIGISEPAIDIVNKTMKIGDTLMWRWIDLLSFEIGIDDAKRLRAETAIAGWQAAVSGEGDMTLLALQDVMVPADGIRIAALLTAAGITASNSEANRKLKERAVKVAGEVVEDPQTVFAPGFEGVLQVGKRNFARVRLIAG